VLVSRLSVRGRCHSQRGIQLYVWAYLLYRLAVTTMMRPQLIVWSGLGHVRRALLIGILFEKKMAIPQHLEDRQGLVAKAQKWPAPPFTQSLPHIRSVVGVAATLQFVSDKTKMSVERRACRKYAFRNLGLDRPCTLWKRKRIVASGTIVVDF